MKYNKSTLKKLQEVFITSGFAIRYEKGQFKSGYCILRDKKVIVINKFFKEKGRIESLLDILQITELDEEKLSQESKTLLKSIEKKYAAQAL